MAFPLPSPSSDLKVPIALDKMGVYVLATFLTKEGEQSLKSATSDTENISVGCEMTKTFLSLVNGWVVHFATSAGKLDMIVY